MRTSAVRNALCSSRKIWTGGCRLETQSTKESYGCCERLI
ncbi:unnamed protein product [Larinioides sclopetarius]|uniref:Uncharacterized protein n=1 Tax=Larinioides sclopetarius TaxID=280406 RepID=A0AAV1YS84_9ARAC